MYDGSPAIERRDVGGEPLNEVVHFWDVLSLAGFIRTRPN